MEHTFKARIYEADSPFFEGELTSVVVPAIDGEYGVLANHRNVVIAIVPGNMHYTLPDGTVEYVIVSEGMMRVENNDVLILINHAERPDEVEINRAREKEEELIEARLQKKSVEEYLEAELMMQRAMAGLRDGGHKVD
ncbi:MAG: ATP synthase F1 subunit epsilon [Lachnospiraceae bacterium]|nr:ATP synthase F1 subunit epsilon [Lachnospiraceae bacterium]MBQ9232960.1 ATP synthase F1 subunit epsilon [Lachnospiraceae bacterium]